MKLIHKATIVNEGRSFIGSVLVEGERISKIFENEVPENIFQRCREIIDARGLYLIPGLLTIRCIFVNPGSPIKAIFTWKAVLLWPVV